MKQQIEPAYATFEQAKKLKELGLLVKSDKYWVMMTKDEYTEMSDVQLDDLDHSVGIGGNLIIAKYQQWQIVEWLRINHGIHVEVSCYVYGELWYANLNVCSKEVWEDEDKRHNILTAYHKFNNGHKSKKEAYSAAFDHILNKLI